MPWIGKSLIKQHRLGFLLKLKNRNIFEAKSISMAPFNSVAPPPLFLLSSLLRECWSRRLIILPAYSLILRGWRGAGWVRNSGGQAEMQWRSVFCYKRRQMQGGPVMGRGVRPALPLTRGRLILLHLCPDSTLNDRVLLHKTTCLPLMRAMAICSLNSKPCNLRW